MGFVCMGANIFFFISFQPPLWRPNRHNFGSRVDRSSAGHEVTTTDALCSNSRIHQADQDFVCIKLALRTHNALEPAYTAGLIRSRMNYPEDEDGIACRFKRRTTIIGSLYSEPSQLQLSGQ